MDEVIPIEWAFASDANDADDPFPRITITRMVSPFYDGVRFAVRRGGACLSTGGKWEREPLPSSRTDGYYKRFRFTTFDAAVKAARKARGEAARE